MRQPDRPFDTERLPAGFAAPLEACARGEMPANVALMQLCMAAPDEAALHELVGALRDWPSAPRPLRDIVRLSQKAPDAFRSVKGVLGAVDHGDTALSADEQLGAYAAAFDKAARLSPEASVALYSLGNETLLADATREIADLMRGWGLLGAERHALEIGCGHGRFVEALAPELASMTGIDISAEMIRAARARCAKLRNVRLGQTEGRDLAVCPDGVLDIVLAVDSFPYIVKCGAQLAQLHFSEAARVLKPRGWLLIFNYSYRGDPAQDRAEVAALCAAAGFTVRKNGTRDLALWDGITFLLQRQAA